MRPPQHLTTAALALALALIAPAAHAGEAIPKLIYRAAAKHGIPARVLAGVVRVESGGNPRAVNGPCRGLTQLDHRWHARGRDLFDPAVNLDVAAGLLASLKRRYATWEKALTCYNRGDAGCRGMASSAYARAIMERR